MFIGIEDSNTINPWVIGFYLVDRASAFESADSGSIPNHGRHDRTCSRARKGHSRSLKSANEQKIFVDYQPFLSRLAQHTLKRLARISLRDVYNLC